jgi:hypothetical protein
VRDLLRRRVQEQIAVLRRPRLLHAWKKYCKQARISPTMPPIACCGILAKRGLGSSTRTGY